LAFPSRTLYFGSKKAEMPEEGLKNASKAEKP
jgi:hypothetical protein